MQLAYLNGKYLPLDKARVNIRDRGFLYGDGAFETIRAYGGTVFQLEKHIERLFGTLKVLGIPPGVSSDKVKTAVYRLLKKGRLGNAYVKIIVTRGISKGLLVPSVKTRATLAIYALPYKGIPEKLYNNGIKLCISRNRFNENSETAGNKTLNYLDNVMIRHNATRMGYDDAVLTNVKGFLSETSSSNFFLVKKRKLYTPNLKSGILPGVTRDRVLCLAKKKLKIKSFEGFVKPQAAYSADEIFLTNSLVEILPVVRIEKKIVGNGKPGDITKMLRNFYKEEVGDYNRRRRKGGG